MNDWRASPNLVFVLSSTAQRLTPVQATSSTLLEPGWEVSNAIEGWNKDRGSRRRAASRRVQQSQPGSVNRLRAGSRAGWHGRHHTA
jgi:hypothetical protein